MRKRVNVITTILFIAAAAAAVIFGWIDDDKAAAGESRTWPICLILLGVCFIIGVARLALMSKARKDEKDAFVPVRSVEFEPSEGQSPEAVLVHVDNVAKDKVVIRVFKKHVPLVDCMSEVNK